MRIHLKNITKIEKYKILIMTEHKTYMNITTYKKLIITEHKTDMNITKIEKCRENLKYKVSKNKHTTDKDKKQPNTLAD